MIWLVIVVVILLALSAAPPLIQNLLFTVLVLGGLAWLISRAGGRFGWLLAPFRRRRERSRMARMLPQRLAEADDPLGAVRAQSREAGGGAFLGYHRDGNHTEWVSADPESAVLVLGPPRSGKTSGILIPALISHAGPAVTTSTKLDVSNATIDARRDLGQIWVLDFAGLPDSDTEGEPMRFLRWSPVTAAAYWDDAQLMARSMVTASPVSRKSTESHWAERSVALLAPLLHAAALGGHTIADVHRWVLRQDLDRPGVILQEHEAEIANDSLVAIAKTQDKERSSIFSTTANVLAAYGNEGPRRAASAPNFDADAFVRSADTIYIYAPAHRQALYAPIVVGLLEEIRHATYRRAHETPDAPAVLYALDECANIAPIHDLPAMVSEGGGQGAHIIACFQDLSQVRARWGDEHGDGFLTLFQTKAILPGIADARTLEAISTVLGEYDRPMVSTTDTAGKTYDREHFFSTGHSTGHSTSHSTHRQRVLTAGEIANTPAGQFLMLRGVQWQLVQLTPYYDINPWPTVIKAAQQRAQQQLTTNHDTPQLEAAS